MREDQWSKKSQVARSGDRSRSWKESTRAAKSSAANSEYLRIKVNPWPLPHPHLNPLLKMSLPIEHGATGEMLTWCLGAASREGAESLLVSLDSTDRPGVPLDPHPFGLRWIYHLTNETRLLEILFTITCKSWDLANLESRGHVCHELLMGIQPQLRGRRSGLVKPRVFDTT